MKSHQQNYLMSIEPAWLSRWKSHILVKFYFRINEDEIYKTECSQRIESMMELMDNICIDFNELISQTKKPLVKMQAYLGQHQNMKMEK